MKFHPRHRLRSFALGAAILTLLVISIPSSTGMLAQEDDGHPVSHPDAIQMSDQWAVRLAPGVDADAAAAQAGFVNAGPVGDGVYLFIAKDSDGFDARRTFSLRGVPGILGADQQEILPLAPRIPTDPLVNDQWHLKNTGQKAGMIPGEDANVFAAWAMGYDGTGVVVASVDDGLWWNNPDLLPNYRPDLSFDFAYGDSDPRPFENPHFTHGTSVGGIMAAAADGAFCGVGVAYNAGLAGLVNPYTDAGDAGAMQYGLAEVDIYNQSWGPFDNGSTMQAPGPLTDAAIQKGITQGRDGKGAIYVWAAGNGKQNGDNINADGWASDRRVIAVGASDFTGQSAYYSEPGAPMLINAPSSGLAGAAFHGTITPSYANGCINSFGGTSSAAPLTAGVVALMLQANPNLTWRDVQAALIASADINDPSHPDWQSNEAGLQFNHSYGFGRVNAEEAVKTALTWQNLPPEIRSESAYLTVNAPFTEDDVHPLVSTINVPENFVVEHVEIYVNALHPRRGDISVSLVSPGGTASRMIEGRHNDTANSNLNNWRMTTVANWGEMSAGMWKLHIWDDNPGDAISGGTLTSWKLVIYGHDPDGIGQELVINELLVNGGFEAGTDGWKLKNAYGDNLKQNKPTKQIARSGIHAFKFKTKADEPARGKLVQKITGAPLASLNAGDVINFSGWYQAKNTPGPGRFALIKIRYPDGTKDKIELMHSLTGIYAQDFTQATLTGTPEKIKIVVRYEGSRGKIFVDDMRLYTSSTAAALDLPAQLPEGDPLPASDLLPLP